VRLVGSEVIDRRRKLILGSGLVFMYAWLLMSLPSWVGIPLLWNHVQPQRMVYASCVLLLIFAAVLANSATFVFSLRSVAMYIAAVIGGWIFFKRIGFADATALKTMALRSNDLVVIPVLLVGMALSKYFLWRPFIVMLGASAASGAIALFYFNPIQSALPIFSRHDTPRIQAINAQVQNPGNILAIPGMAGAVLNGLGYASVSHVTAVPALEFWRKRYPDMLESEFLGVFNRYSHIRLAPIARPETPQADVVSVPIRDFWPNRVEVPRLSSAPLEPLWFLPREIAYGQVVVGRAGVLDNVAVMIGTNQGRSDGNLQLRICVENESVCATGNTALAHAVDVASRTIA